MSERKNREICEENHNEFLEKQRTMEPSEVLKNYIDQLTTNEQYNVYEIDSNIEWNNLLYFRQTSECEKINIIMDKFEGIRKKRFLPGFWDSKVSHKLYMLILRVKLEFYTMESLYKITKNDFEKNYGGGFIDKYNNNISCILTSLNPEQENLRMFGSFKGKTPSGTLTVDCWDEENPEKPDQIFMNSTKKYKFKCDACPHTFDSRVDSIVSGNWCPYCANKELCENSLSCPTCLPKTFLSFKGKRPNGIPTVEYWHEDNLKKPHEVFMNSAKKYKFNCDACPHTFDSRLSTTTNGSWCPYCAIPSKKLCEDSLSCPMCLPKTFHSFEGKRPNGIHIVEYWHEDNPKKPHEVFMNSHKIFKFKCDTCPHTFDSALNNIVKGNWCPTCKNKTEKLVFEFLQTLFLKEDVKRRFTHEKVRNNRDLPFDICILSHQIIIEVDGIQHFLNVSHFKSNAVEQCERDCKKMKIIFEEGYSVIRIVQEDIWLAKTRDKMLTKLEKAIQECIHHELPMIHYISMDDSMYDNHKLNFKEKNFDVSS